MDNNLRGGNPQYYVQGRQNIVFPEKENPDIFSFSFNGRIAGAGDSKKNVLSLDDMTINGNSAEVRRRRDPITTTQSHAYVRKSADSPFGCYDLATPRIARRSLETCGNIHERSATMPSPTLFPQNSSPSLKNVESRKLRHVKSLDVDASTIPDTLPSPRRSRKNVVQRVANMFSSKSNHHSSCPSLSDDEEVNGSTSTLNDVSFSSNFEEDPVSSRMTTVASSSSLVSIGGGSTKSSPSSPGNRKKTNTKKWLYGKITANSKVSAPNNSGVTAWNCMSDIVWINSDGQVIQLDSTSLVNLSHLEWQILRKIAQLKLNEFNLGSVSLPKDPSLKTKKGLLGKSKSSNFLYNLKDNLHVNKEAKDTNVGMVFGIPLVKCLYNDSQLKQKRNCVRRGRRESLDLAAANPAALRIKPVVNNIKERKVQALLGLDLGGRFNGDGPPPTLIDALSLSTSSTDKHREEQKKALSPHQPEIPNIVTCCFKHLEKYGMQVKGIFRVGGSKKRIRQLHEDYDNGEDIHMNESHTPHDVAALLKEYFRDLPEPLMTRELYSTFLSAACVEDRCKRVLLLQQLTALLPVANRDTLYALLQFLNKVSSCAEQTVDEQGQEVPGNKMDSSNLATLFGPNILHKRKIHKEDNFHVVKAERAEENKEVIEVIKFMIDNYKEIFEISAATHCEILRSLQDTDCEASDYILNKKLSKEKSESINIEEANDSDCSPTSPQRNAIDRLNSLITSQNAHWPSKLQMLTEASSSDSETEKEIEEKSVAGAHGTGTGYSQKMQDLPLPGPSHTIPPYKSEMTVSYARQQQEKWLKERTAHNMSAKPAVSSRSPKAQKDQPQPPHSTDSTDNHGSTAVAGKLLVGNSIREHQQVVHSGSSKMGNTSNNNLQPGPDITNSGGLNQTVANRSQKEQQWLLWELLTSEDGKETLV